MSANEIVEQRLLEMAKDGPSTIFDVGFNSVVTAASKNFLKEGWDATVQKVALMEKVATLQDEDFVAGQQAAIELLSTLSENEYLSLIQGETQMNFEFGKKAAYADFVEMAENGAGFSDVMHAVQNTLNEDLEKTASEDDVDARLGIDAACYEFLKVASEIHGEYDLSDADDQEILDAILMKIAKDERSKDDVKKGLYERYNLKGGVGPAKGKIARESVERNLGSRSKKESLNPVASAGAEKIKGSAIDTLRYKMKGLSGKQKAGIGAGAAGLAAVGAGGAYAMHRRNKAKQEQEKSAGDNRVQEALEILAEAGLLDD